MIEPLRRFLISLIFVAVSASSIVPQEDPCPTVSLECVSAPCCESPFVFAVHVTGSARRPTLSYTWAITAGRIISGQGSPSIKVDSPPWAALSATVEINGLDPKCPRVASITQTICDGYPTVSLFDQYSDISFTKEKLRLDRFARLLRNIPGMKGYVLVTGDSGRAQRAKTYLLGSGMSALRAFGV